MRHLSAQERTSIATPKSISVSNEPKEVASLSPILSWRMLTSYFELEKFACFCFVLFFFVVVYFFTSLCQCYGNLEILIHFLISSPFNVGDIQDPYELFVLQPL